MDIGKPGGSSMKRVVLLGGGHIHVRVRPNVARQALAGRHVNLVTPYRRPIYYGMLPGWIAGQRTLDACAIKLDELASSGLWRFTRQRIWVWVWVWSETPCVGADDSEPRFDALSIDTGAMPALLGLRAASSKPPFAAHRG